MGNSFSSRIRSVSKKTDPTSVFREEWPSVCCGPTTPQPRQQSLRRPSLEGPLAGAAHFLPPFPSQPGHRSRPGKLVVFLQRLCGRALRLSQLFQASEHGALAQNLQILGARDSRERSRAPVNFTASYCACLLGSKSLVFKTFFFPQTRTSETSIVGCDPVGPLEALYLKYLGLKVICISPTPVFLGFRKAFPNTSWLLVIFSRLTIKCEKMGT